MSVRGVKRARLTSSSQARWSIAALPDVYFAGKPSACRYVHRDLDLVVSV